MDAIEAAAGWAGVTLSPEALDRLAAFSRWLVDEAIPAGGLGPGEASRIDSRHVADSLTLAWAWRRRSHRSIIDLGSGVGLPGIPLAITHPDSRVTLVDSAARRCRLAQRAIRVLGLGNVDVRQGDIRRPVAHAEVVVSRAVMPPGRLAGILAGWLEPGGIGVIAATVGDPPVVTGLDVVEVPGEVLDRRQWLLIMAPP
jgi:16S rRNA (guanine527-N7)-methyltransferase